MASKTLNATDIIKKHHGEIVDSYVLINNWGYTVSHDGSQYDVRRLANCYGSDCGWDVTWLSSRGGKKDEDWIKAVEKDLNNADLNSEW